MLLYFIRHGETARNKEKRIMGSSDIPLTETGLHQATIFGKSIASVPFDAIYSSPLLRAYQTAEFLNTYQQETKEIQPDPRLKERDYGVYEGTAHENLNRIFNKETKPEDRIEEETDANTRFDTSISEIITNHENNHTIAIVSHGGQIGSRLQRTFAMDFPHLGNTSITIIEWNEGKMELIKLNDTQHLL